MSGQNWAEMVDDELDEALRREMAVLQASVQAPRVDAGALTRRRPRFALGDPTSPRRLAPAAMAVGLAVLLAVGSGTWFAVGRLHGRNGVPASHPTPRLSPAPTPGANGVQGSLPSTVPAGVPVFWYAARTGQPGGMVRLQAVDWNGTPRGHLDLAIPGRGALGADAAGGLPGVTQSPDGERLLVDSGVYSSDGKLRYVLPQRTPGRTTWGDDSRTMCLLTRPLNSSGNPAEQDLVVLDDTGTRRPVTAVLQLGDPETEQRVLACAASTDRVVSYAVSVHGVTALRVSRMSSNKVLLQQTICTPDSRQCPLSAGISVTPDARTAAESDADGVVRIRDLASGRTHTLPQRGGVLRISADGSSVLLGRVAYDWGTTPYPLRLVDTRSGAVLWTGTDADVILDTVGAQPGGSSLAVAFRPHVPQATPPPNDYVPITEPLTLVLLHGRGARPVSADAFAMVFQSS